MLLIQDTVAVETMNTSSTTDSKPSITVQSFASESMQRSMTLANVVRTKDDSERPSEINIQSDHHKGFDEKTKPRVGSQGDSKGQYHHPLLIHSILLLF